MITANLANDTETKGLGVVILDKGHYQGGILRTRTDRKTDVDRLELDLGYLSRLANQFETRSVYDLMDSLRFQILNNSILDRLISPNMNQRHLQRLKRQYQGIIMRAFRLGDNKEDSTYDLESEMEEPKICRFRRIA